MSKYKKLVENRYFSRRQFLIGAGKTVVTLPPLLSLMPLKVAAQVQKPRVRMMTFVGVYGIDPHQLYPIDNSISMTRFSGAAHTNFMNLNNLQEKVSRVLDFTTPELSGLQGKTNLYRGLAMAGGSYAGHNHSILSGTHSGGRTPTLGKSIDVIVEQALGVNAIRLKTTSGLGKANEFSFDRDSTGNRKISNLTFGDENLFRLLFPSGTQSAPAVTNSGPTRDESVIDLVLNDVNALLNHQRLSVDDKLRLQEYVDGVNDLQKRIISNREPNSSPIKCGTSNLSYEVRVGSNTVQSTDRLFENYADIITLAVQCDQSRIVHIANTAISNSNSNGAHPELHHDCTGASDGSAERQAWFLRRVARLAKKLDARVDPFDPNGGTLLDNSILLWTNELGSWTTHHSVTNIPAVTFGSGGGYFRTGLYADYRIRPLVSAKNGAETLYMGRPYKQLLISIMRAAGLQSTQYLKFGDGKGFGEFKVGYANTNYTTSAFQDFVNEHNNPLPYVSVGG